MTTTEQHQDRPEAPRDLCESCGGLGHIWRGREWRPCPRTTIDLLDHAPYRALVLAWNVPEGGPAEWAKDGVEA